MGFDNKIALVTGSSRGIGKVIALKLAEQGVDVVVNYPFEGEKENAEAVVAEIEALGANATAIEADVTDNDSVKRMFKEIKDQFGTLNILVNNAGITRDGLLLRMKEKDWKQVIDVNLTGAFNVTKSALRLLMKADEARIINVSSVVGLMGNAGQANYSASKAGLIGFTKSTAKEVAKRGVTVNAVAPGFIETAMTDKLKDDVVEQMINAIPANKFGQPEDVADTVLFLASSKAQSITGEVIRVDGGMVM